MQCFCKRWAKQCIGQDPRIQDPRIQDPRKCWPPQATLDETSCDCKLFPYLWPQLPLVEFLFLPGNLVPVQINMMQAWTKAYFSNFSIFRSSLTGVQESCSISSCQDQASQFSFSATAWRKKLACRQFTNVRQMLALRHQRGWWLYTSSTCKAAWRVTFNQLGTGPGIHSSQRSLLFIHWTTNQLHHQWVKRLTGLRKATTNSMTDQNIQVSFTFTAAAWRERKIRNSFIFGF